MKMSAKSYMSLNIFENMITTVYSEKTLLNEVWPKLPCLCVKGKKRNFVPVLKEVGEWRYRSTILDLGSKWRCYQLHGLAVLPPRKYSLVPFEQQVGWAPGPILMLWSTEKYLCLLEIKPRSFVQWSVVIPTKLSSLQFFYMLFSHIA
jgi:hypothetical protein